MKNEVLMQLFVDGPTWDGNLISKTDRDELVSVGLCERKDGWNFLTSSGVDLAIVSGLMARDWSDKRFYRKAAKLS